jgi:uncharacterized protein YutE (UPF0331/DUF86 family)
MAIQAALNADDQTRAYVQAMSYRLKMLSERSVDTPQALCDLAGMLPQESFEAERKALEEAAMVLQDAAQALANGYGVVQKIEQLIGSKDVSQISEVSQIKSAQTS